MEKQDLLSKLISSLKSGEREDAKAAVTAALGGEVAVKEILGVIAGTLDEVGRKFQKGELFLPELVMSGVTAEEAIKILSPYIKTEGIQSAGKIVIGTVRGDIHDLGKTIVVTMLNSAGFTVYDLGVDVAASKFIEKAKEVEADIIASCALMSTTKTRMKDLEEELVKAGIKGRLKTLIGGAAVSEEYAREIGADGYGKDAFEAVTKARSLVHELRSKGGM